MKLLTYQPHRKIYYPAGSISLILLPLLCLLWLQKHKAFEQYRMLDIAFWSSKEYNSLPIKLREEFPAKRIYTEITLTGNDSHDQTSLDYAQQLFEQFRKSRDTVRAIHFHFGIHAKYWTFIRAIDICVIEKVPYYAPYQNDMYAFYRVNKPVKNSENTLFCGTRDAAARIAAQRWRMEKKAAFYNDLKHDSWAPCLAFAGMAIFAFRKIRKNRLLPA